MTSVERVLSYINIEPEAPERTDISLEITDGKVEFRNVSMKYREHLEPALRNLSFIIDGGMKVGIVGRTGAGKSSILQTLFRLVEMSEGSILIDGQDITKIGLIELR